MKKLITLSLLLLACTMKAQLPSETWNYQGYSIGMGAAASATTTECFMPEIARVGSQYIMYYTGRKYNRPAIFYATSSNMINWVIGDTIITGATDTTSREYEVGGPSVIKLNSGQYRMFYRTCQKFSSGTPKYHVRSLISNNGIVFTKEAGVRIEIKPYQSNSFFTLAGQSAFYRDASGNIKAILTARDTVNSGTNLYTAASPDEGVTWGSFVKLYNNGHDAVVIKDSTYKYHVYYSYLMSGHKKAVSSNGITWPVTADSILLKQGTTALTENSSPNMVADLGAGVDAMGATVLYSNHKPTAPGPWINVAYYFMQPTAINENESDKSFSVFPNPGQSNINVIASDFKGEMKFIIQDVAGREVLTSKSNQINISCLQSGLYYLQVFNAKSGEQIGLKKIIKN